MQIGKWNCLGCIRLKWNAYSLPACHLFTAIVHRRIVNAHTRQSGPLRGASVIALRIRGIYSEQDARSNAIGPWTAGVKSDVRQELARRYQAGFTATGRLRVKLFIVFCTKALIYHANAFRSRPPSNYTRRPLRFVDVVETRQRVSSCLLSRVCSASILQTRGGDVEVAWIPVSCNEHRDRRLS